MRVTRGIVRRADLVGIHTNASGRVLTTVLNTVPDFVQKPRKTEEHRDRTEYFRSLRPLNQAEVSHTEVVRAT